ncbi:MAG: S1C family serine protease [Alphaproteobacteria bacterium]
MPISRRLAMTGAAALLPAARASAQEAAQRLRAIVRLRCTVPADSRTAASLGRQRQGSGVLIDQSGLVLTIGYLMVEADGAEVTLADGRTLPAQVVGYDHETGFGLLRTIEPPRMPAAPLGRSASLAEHAPVMIAAHEGGGGARPGFVLSRRPLAGSWEYLREEAIFTAPPHPEWSGAGLFDAEGRLVGIGSLMVGDANGRGANIPGNMFVPIDLLPPILGDLIAEGAPSGPRRPWLGIATEELRGRLLVTRITPGGPAERAGVEAGDIVLGVAGAQVRDLADFYRRLWASGDAGSEVGLLLLDGTGSRGVTIRSVDRHSQLKLRRTY